MRTSFRLLDMTSFLLLCGSGQEGAERPKWQTYRLGCTGHHKIEGGVADGGAASIEEINWAV